MLPAAHRQQARILIVEFAHSTPQPLEPSNPMESMKSQEEMIVFARQVLGLSESASLEFLPLGGRGSDRVFYRLKWNQRDTVILVHYDPVRLENSYYADIASFLHDIDIPVPRLIGHDPTRCFIVMKDLGDTDLWSLRNAPWETRQVHYQKALTIIHRLHSFRTDNFPSDRVRLMPRFDPDLYRWERDYFRENFVKGICGIRLDGSFEGELERELSGLAGRLSETRPSLVHRDLQSQNVMILNEEPYLIDFQGMRFGSLLYDLGSLLSDPYAGFSEGEVDELLSFYYGLAKRDSNWPAFRKSFWEASAQRLMQALGAYGFLGLKKGLRAFLDHIPAGLRNLRRATSNVTSLPRLRELAMRCQRELIKRGNSVSGIQ